MAAALSSGRALALCVAEGARGLDGLAQAARARGVPVERVARPALVAQAGPDAQGCAALVRPLRPLALETLVAAALQRAAGGRGCLLVALDHVQDPRNLGAIARSLEAAGGGGVIVPARRAAPVTPAAERAAAGAFDFLPWAEVHNLAQALDRCRATGFWVFGATPDGSRLWTEAAAVDWAPRSVLVLGAEGRGLSPLVRRRCDRLLALPTPGRTASLNASVAAGVFIYDWVRWALRGETAR